MTDENQMAVTVEQIDKDAACDLLRTMGVDIGGITLHWASNAMARHRVVYQSALPASMTVEQADIDAAGDLCLAIKEIIDQEERVVWSGAFAYAARQVLARHRLAQQSVATGAVAIHSVSGSRQTASGQDGATLGRSNIVESDGLCRFDPGSDTAVAEVKALGGSTPPSTATHHERLNPAGYLLEHPTHGRDYNYSMRLTDADKADGWTETPLYRLSTAPSNPPAPSDGEKS